MLRIPLHLMIHESVPLNTLPNAGVSCWWLLRVCIRRLAVHFSSGAILFRTVRRANRDNAVLELATTPQMPCAGCCRPDAISVGYCRQLPAPAVHRFPGLAAPPVAARPAAPPPRGGLCAAGELLAQQP